MSNPVLVEAVRGRLVENGHTGAVAVSDADGGLVLSLGAVDRPIYPRSAVKALQALPLIESGVAERLGLTDPEIALAVASHGGEEAHVEGVAAILAKVGRDASALECGSHPPSYRKAAEALVRAGLEPNALHNGCSGKHAGFICLACAIGHEPAGYGDARHPVMREVMGTMAEMADAALDEEHIGIDGCSIPTQAVRLSALARGFARFGCGLHLGPLRARAARRIRKAVAANPFMVAGSGRFCTRLMETFGERLFVKSGADGVFCAALPERGLGVALKCDDGAGRAAEVMMAAVIARFAAPLDEAETDRLASFLAPIRTSWNGTEVGHLRAAGPLALDPFSAPRR
jgi:L-asparaginase II